MRKSNRLLAILLAVLMAVSVFPVSVFAADNIITAVDTSQLVTKTWFLYSGDMTEWSGGDRRTSEVTNPTFYNKLTVSVNDGEHDLTGFTWTRPDDYDPKAVGEKFTFTAVAPVGFEFDVGVAPPEIEVEIIDGTILYSYIKGSAATIVSPYKEPIALVLDGNNLYDATGCNLMGEVGIYMFAPGLLATDLYSGENTTPGLDADKNRIKGYSTNLTVKGTREKVTVGGALNTTVYGDTNLILEGVTAKQGVYAGGMGRTASAEARVEGHTHVTVVDSTLTSLYGGGFAGRQQKGQDVTVTGNAYIDVSGEVDIGAIYGGGFSDASTYTAPVEKTAYINIHGLTGEWTIGTIARESAKSGTGASKLEVHLDDSSKSLLVDEKITGASTAGYTEAEAGKTEVYIKTGVYVDSEEYGDELFVGMVTMPEDFEDPTSVVKDTAAVNLPVVENATWTYDDETAGPKTFTLIANKGYFFDGLVKSQSYDVTVKPAAVESVKISGPAEVGVESSIVLTATVEPAYADQTVEWSSDNEDVATVKDGHVTAVSVGTANITATAGGKKDTYKVTVKAKPVAEVDGDKYETLAEAVAVGGEVTLLENIGLTEAVVITEDVTINLNGKNVTSVGDVFEVTAGTLTINGEGNVTGGTSGVGSWTAVWANSGAVVINGGTYSVGGDSTEGVDPTHQNDVIYTKNGGTVVINGGTFLNDGTVWTLNENDSNRGTITVNGGTFQNWSPEDNASEGEGTTFVSDGYISPATTTDGDGNVIYVVKEGQYVAEVDGVKYETLAEAVKAAEEDSTVTLLGNASGAGVVIKKNVTIDFAGYTYTFTEGVGSTGTESNGFQIRTGTVVLKNGTLKVAEESKDKFYILVQNYADLTVEDMTLDGTNLDKWSTTDGDSYVLSVNSGDVAVTGNTSITANDDGDKAFAFDVCKFGAYTAPTVTVDTKGTITGKIEVTTTSTEGKLVIKNGTFDGEISVNDDAEVAISGGTYTVALEKAWCAEGFVPADNGAGTYGVKVRATYTEVDAAKVAFDAEVAKTDLYTAESIEAAKDVYDAIGINWDLSVDDQATVNGYVDEINNAKSKLELSSKPTVVLKAEGAAEDGKVETGETFTVTVSVKNINEAESVKWKLTYDDKRFTLGGMVTDYAKVGTKEAPEISCDKPGSIVNPVATYTFTAKTKAGLGNISISDVCINRIDNVWTDVDNAADGKTVQVDVVLRKMTAEVSYDGGEYNHPYDGVARTLTVVPSVGGAVVYYKVNNGEETTTAPVFVNAGTYTVSYRVYLEGYEGVSGSETVVIEKATLSDATVSYNNGKYTHSYDGTERTLTIESLEDAEITYTVSKDGAAATANDLKFVDAGKYEVNYTLTKDNYNEKTGSVTIEIAKSTALSAKATYRTEDVTDQATIDHQYDGNSYTYEVTPNIDGATVTINGDVKNSVEINGVGTYDIAYTVAMNNYEEVTGSVKITVTEGTIKTPVVTYNNGAYNHPYDGVARTLTVTTETPDVTITYKVNGEPTTELTFTETGKYVVEYTITKNGYTTVNGTATVEITAILYIVEVDLGETDYVAGRGEVGDPDYVAPKKLVLVYTDEDLAFTYDGDPMYEVTDKGYKYKAPGEKESEHNYEHVYALVVDAIDGGDLEDYKAMVEDVAGVAANKIDYTNKYKITGDPNNDVTWNDITAAYNAITNSEASYADWMPGCIKADVNGDKRVTSADAGLIVNAYNDLQKNK